MPTLLEIELPDGEVPALEGERLDDHAAREWHASPPRPVVVALVALALPLPEHAGDVRGADRRDFRHGDAVRVRAQPPRAVRRRAFQPERLDPGPRGRSRLDAVRA